jgi:EmrB/QacA subfamily drug resistance transporter
MSIKDNPTDHGTAAAHSGDRWWTLGIVTLATFLLALDLTVVNVALPSLRTALDASFSDLQWVIDAYALTLAVFLLSSGSLADRLGRRRIFNLGFLLFTAASLLCGVASNVLTLNLARGLQGTGAAVLFAVGPALIGHAFRGKVRGLAFSIFGGGVGLGLALGPLIGGALTDGISWRWIFLINVPIGLLCLALGVTKVTESRDPRTHQVDIGGLITFSAALALLVLALLRGEREGWTSSLIIGMFAGAAVMLAAFVVIQARRGEAAMLDLRLFRKPTFIAISAVAALMTATSMSAFFLLILYLQNILGHSPWETGVRFLTLTGALFVAAAIGGLLTAKLPFRLIIGFGSALLAAGLALVAPMLDAQSTWTDLVPSMVLMGLGIGIYNPARASISIAVVEPRKAGMASGINETFQQAGWALGVAGFGALFEARVAHHFTSSEAAAQLGASAERASSAIAAGSIDALTQTMPPAAVAELTAAAESAFLSGLLDVMPITAVVAMITAIIGFAFIRNRDLDPSALGGLPGARPEIADLEAAEDAPTGQPHQPDRIGVG